MIRIGHGFDVHAFEEGGELVLGGVHVPHTHSLAAHSDGDVAIHALCDALLGAAGLGDIGQHFPDNDDAYKNINSRMLLRQVVVMLQKANLAVSNVDLTIVAQEPKLAPYLPSMRQHLAHDLKMKEEDVNIKATTTEWLGFTGRAEGIAVHAVCLLHRP